MGILSQYYGNIIRINYGNIMGILSELAMVSVKIYLRLKGKR